MPSYDVKCSHCSYENMIQMKISEVNDWDSMALCPQCAAKAPAFGRIMTSAPRCIGGDKASARSKLSQKESNQQRFVSSGEKDDMRHKESKTRDRNAIGEAIEIVKQGKYEGF
jgi:hypothetical protein